MNANLEKHPDDIAVDKFAEAMKEKLANQRAKGYKGWDDKELCPDGSLQPLLVNHVYKGDPVDVGNFAMMLFNRNESTIPALEPIAYTVAVRGEPGYGLFYSKEQATENASVLVNKYEHKAEDVSVIKLVGVL